MKLVLQQLADPGEAMNTSLLKCDPNKMIIEHINIPGLHILLGVVDKLITEIEKNLFESKEEGVNFMTEYLNTINLGRVSYQGQHRLEGNASNKFLKNVDKLEAYFGKHNVGLQGAKYIEILRDFNKVVQGCFGKTVSETYVEDIDKFSRDFRGLSISVLSKYILLNNI